MYGTHPDTETDQSSRPRGHHEHHGLHAGVRAPSPLKGSADTANLLPIARQLAWLTDRVTLQFTDDGIAVETLNDTNVIGFEAIVPVEYETDHEPVAIEVNTSLFYDACSFMDNPETVRLSLCRDETELTATSENYIDYIDYIDVHEPGEPADAAAYMDLDYSTATTVPASGVKQAVAGVMGTEREDVFVSLYDGELWTEVPGVAPAGSVPVTEMDGPATYTQLGTTLIADLLGNIHPNEALRVQVKKDHPLHIEGEHFEVAVAPHQFPEADYEPLSEVGE